MVSVPKTYWVVHFPASTEVAGGTACWVQKLEDGELTVTNELWKALKFTVKTNAQQFVNDLAEQDASGGLVRTAYTTAEQRKKGLGWTYENPEPKEGLGVEDGDVIAADLDHEIIIVGGVEEMIVYAEGTGTVSAGPQIYEKPEIEDLGKLRDGPDNNA